MEPLQCVQELYVLVGHVNVIHPAVMVDQVAEVVAEVQVDQVVEVVVQQVR